MEYDFLRQVQVQRVWTDSFWIFLAFCWTQDDSLPSSSTASPTTRGICFRSCATIISRFLLVLQVRIFLKSLKSIALTKMRNLFCHQPVLRLLHSCTGGESAFTMSCLENTFLCVLQIDILFIKDCFKVFPCCTELFFSLLTRKLFDGEQRLAVPLGHC